MMQNKVLTRRYGEAFLSWARGTIGLELAVEELKNFKIVLAGNPELKTFLYNPEIGCIDKSLTLTKIMKDRFSEEILDFVRLLIEKNRIKYVLDICDYVRVKYGHGQSLEAVLKSSYPLDLDLVEMIKKKMETKFKSKLTMYLELDPGLLGGIQIRVGNIVIDGSVKRRLDELKGKLRMAQVG
ncbi:MAG TPA: ATP synthase F1 subunit delta [Candidatus Omnitrophota bacterium]|nr:ATP synthase F1 subunit delta [Candidatus Omnitrophota bacterium]HPT07301.1 ATP synthase F1 subunit delta [Candidatus Omnitrophota bacterium]